MVCLLQDERGTRCTKKNLDIFKSQEKTAVPVSKSTLPTTKGASQKGSSRSLTKRMMNEIPDDYMGKTKVSDEQRKNHLDICEALKLPKREPKPMSFIDADNGMSNVDRQKSETMDNCTSCVMANEMRRRGFNVTAKGQIEDVADDIKKCWLTKKEKEPNFEIDPQKLTSKNEKALYQMIERLVNVPQGRYILAWDGQGEMLGHVLCVEKINIELCFYDPQESSNSSFWNFSEIFNIMNKSKGLELLRIDNLLINVEYVLKMVKRL